MNMKTILQGRSSIRRSKPHWQPHKPAQGGAAPLPRHEARPFPPALRAAAIGLVFLLADIALAGGVFLPAGPTPPASNQTVQASAGEARHGRLVRIAHNELRRARAEVGNFGQSRLLFNMSEHMEFDVAIERTARTLNGYTLSGQIDGGKGGFVTLAVHPEAVAGSIWTWEENYQIVPVGTGVHAVRQVKHDHFECHTPPQRSSVAASPYSLANNTNNEDAVIDILVFWTPDREQQSLNEQALLAHIDLTIAYTNDALERSGALVSLNLVGAERLYVEDESHSVLFQALKSEYATERADALGADFIHLTKTGFGGEASGPLSVAGPLPFVFAHEIGHSFGVAHDRGTAEFHAIRSYDNAYTFISAEDAFINCYTTLVAYADACVQAGVRSLGIPYYSTPSRYHPITGAPLGVSRLTDRRGFDGPADAVLEINRNRHRNSDIRFRSPVP